MGCFPCNSCRFQIELASGERIGYRERANRCDYFEPGASQAGTGDGAEQHTQSALEDLFKKG